MVSTLDIPMEMQKKISQGPIPTQRATSNYWLLKEKERPLIDYPIPSG